MLTEVLYMLAAALPATVTTGYHRAFTSHFPTHVTATALDNDSNITRRNWK